MSLVSKLKLDMTQKFELKTRFCFIHTWPQRWTQGQIHRHLQVPRQKDLKKYFRNLFLQQFKNNNFSK